MYYSNFRVLVEALVHWFLLVQFVPWQAYPSTKLLGMFEDISVYSVSGCLGFGTNKLNKTINSKPIIPVHKSSTGPLLIIEGTSSRLARVKHSLREKIAKHTAQPHSKRVEGRNIPRQ